MPEFDNELEWFNAILQQPRNPELREQFISWLEEQSDPLGGYLRQSQKSSQLDLLDPRSLLYRSSTEEGNYANKQRVFDWIHGWSKSVYDLVRLDFVSGFPAIVSGMPEGLRVFFQSQHELYPLIAGLRLVSDSSQFVSKEFDEDVHRLFALPLLGQISEIDCRWCRSGPALLDSLIQAPALSNVTSFNFDNSELQLPEDYIRECEGVLGADDMHRFSTNLRTRPLHQLNLSDHQIGYQGFQHLLNMNGIQSLKYLHLAGNGLGDEGIALLAGATQIRNLEVLDISRNNISSFGVSHLRNAAFLPKLHTLYVDGNPLGDDGLEVFCDPCFSRIQILCIDDIGCTEIGFRGFALKHQLNQLRCFSSNRNRIDSEGFTPFIKKKFIRKNITSLHLAGNRLNAITGLYIQRFLPNLKYLKISVDVASYDFVTHMLGSTAPSIERLIIVDTLIASDERVTLEKEFGDRIKFL